MTQFDHLARLRPAGQSDLTLYQIRGEPTLTMKPAAEANKPYYTALIKRNSRNSRRVAAGKVNAKMLKQSRDEDRELFAKYVIVGWADVMDSAGESVGFSKENCYDYLKALPDWLFDEVRQFASEPENFIEDEDEPAPGPEEVVDLGE